MQQALSERQLQGMPRSASRRFFETYRCVGKRCKTFRSAPLMQRTPDVVYALNIMVTPVGGKMSTENTESTEDICCPALYEN